jgi:SNF2 family DNA or RNA helicase
MAEIIKAPSDVEAHIELSNEGDKLVVWFDYNPDAVKAVKSVSGHKFNKNYNDSGPAWMFPLDITVAQRLREVFDLNLTIGPKARAWAKAETERNRNLSSLSVADDAECPGLKAYLPELREWLRPYQRAGVSFMAEAGSVVNSDHPGLGKTIQTIASIFESDTDCAPQLVIAPKTSLDLVWIPELERWQEYPVLSTSGDDSRETREEILNLAAEMAAEELPFWLVINPAMVRYYADKTAERILVSGKWEYPKALAWPIIHEIQWKNVIIDEFHAAGLGNTGTGFYQAVQELNREHIKLLSGTPVGGKPVKLFGALHTIDPDRWPSKWRWVDEWLDTENMETPRGTVKKVLGIHQGREEAFYDHLRPVLVRRTKDEVLKDLPPKQYIDIWCDMTARQAKQYRAMEASAEVKIEEENLTAVGILAEYTRLKQFAASHHTVKNMGDGKMIVSPTGDSGKKAHVLEILEELGITGKEEDDTGDEQVVIASQWSSVIEMVARWLRDANIQFAKITGDVSAKARKANADDFQAGNVRVFLITTTAGGVAITLDRASTMIQLDETWNPDDQEQVEDRIHRISRIHQVTIYRIRSKGTIEEYIEQVTMNKADINREILDVHRRIAALRAKRLTAAA